METDINKEILHHLRSVILESMLTLIRDWDGTIESGIDIIKVNHVKLEKLQSVNMKLSTVHIDTIDDKGYKNKLLLLLDEQKKLVQSLRDKQNALLEGIKQLNKKDQVINNYISKSREAIFINKSL